MGHSAARGTLIYEKNLKLKILCQTPLKPLAYTVRTVAADLRRGEHIPKMQNNIDRKSMLRVLRQLRSKDRGGRGAGGAVPCRATPRGARPGDFLQISNLPLYQLRHTFLM
jgi:hypothetical protein